MTLFSNQTVQFLNGIFEAFVRSITEIAAFGLIIFLVPFLEHIIKFSIEYNLPSVMEAIEPHLKMLTGVIVVGIYAIMGMHLFVVLIAFITTHYKWGGGKAE